MMDKRLFLAFSLSGLVIVATPFLFPRAKVPPAPAAAAAGVPVLAAETLAVNTKVSHTHFTTLGAAPILVELPGFKSLGANNGVVSIYQKNEPLLRYRVLAGNDTLDLSKLTFSTIRASRGRGEQEV